jgi:hypothetical protein
MHELKKRDSYTAYTGFSMYSNRYQINMARMFVPKLVKNGFNSSFGVLGSPKGLVSEWITETVANGKK